MGQGVRRRVTSAGRSRARAAPDPAAIDRPWLASYPPGVPRSYGYPAVPLTRLLDDAARDFPEVAGTSYGGAELTYEAIVDQVDRLATALADVGVARGTPVALVLPNLPATVVGFFAVLRLGGVVVLTDAAAEEELAADLLDSGAEVAICTRVEQLEAVHAHLPALRHLIWTSERDWRGGLRHAFDRLPLLRRRTPRGSEAVHLHGLLAGTDPLARQARITADDVAVTCYVTRDGQRRGVELTHANLVANTFQARLWVPDTQAGRERVLGGAAFHHPYGLTTGLLAAALSASTLVLPFDLEPESLLATAATYHPTLFAGLAATFAALAAHPAARKRDLTSLRACLSYGDALASDLADEFERVSGARLREAYGQEEAAGLTHANPIYGRAQRGTVGLPVTDTVAVVVDPDDPTRVLPPGETGALAVFGPQVARGYRGEGEPARVGDGWLLTGERATMDERGYFSVGRSEPEVGT